MTAGSAPDPAHSRLAANTLTLALLCLVPSWFLGLEQVVPGLVLLVGCWRLHRSGGLSWTAEAIGFALLILWSLTSIGALVGPAQWLIYLRGEVHLVVALATWFLALRIDPESDAWRRMLKLMVLFIGVILAVSLLLVEGILPLQTKSLLGWLLPDLDLDSTFLNEFVLNRQFATEAGVSLLKDIKRQSLFFLYQGGLTTVLLLWIGWMVMARRRLRGAWKLAATAGATAALMLGVLTGSRSGLVLAAGVVLALGLWSLIENWRWRRHLIRVLVGLVLLFGIYAAIPRGDGTSLEHGAPWERALTDFRVKSFLDRVEVYRDSVERMNERPLTGWGVQGSPREGRRYLKLGTHSEPLNVAFRFGWVGLFLALMAAGAYVVRLARCGRRSPDAAISVLVLLALAATGMVRTFQWDLNVLWLVVAFLGTSRVILAPERSPEALGPGGEFAMLGARLNARTMDDLHGAMESAIVGRSRVVIGHQNLHGLSLLPRKEAMREFARVSDVTFLDGMALVWMARALGYDVGREHRVTYADWLAPLTAESERKGWRVFHLGGRPGVGEQAAQALRDAHPRLEIATHPGYFEPGETPAIIERISTFRPDVLMVGMGMPRQEAWLAANLDKIDAGAILTCGACMDYVAGVIATPPRWTGRVGLEWLFRLATEPRRLAKRYLVEPWPVMARFVGEWWVRGRQGST